MQSTGRAPDDHAPATEVPRAPDGGWVPAEALARAQADSAAKSALLARVSHELRTPLHTILGSLELLDRPDDPDVARMTVAARHLHALVDDLTEVARIEADVALSVTDVALDDVLDEAVALVAPGRIDRTGTEGLWVRADRRRLVQVVVNLLANAVRHTPPGSPVLVVRGVAADATDLVELRVVDAGPGVDPADRDQVFEPFVSGSGDGIGLGLTIARGLAEAMGGHLTLVDAPVGASVDASNAAPVGATFALTVPRGAADPSR